LFFCENIILFQESIPRQMIWPKPVYNHSEAKFSFIKEKDENYDYCQKPELEYLELKTDFSQGTMRMSVKTNQIVCHKLSSEEIKQLVIGKNKEELNQIFQVNPGIKDVEVNLWPMWIKKVPNSLDKIKILVDPAPFKS